MFLQSMLRWPWFLIVFTVASLFTLSSPGWAGLLRSSAVNNPVLSGSRIEMEKEMIAARLEEMGLSRDEIGNRLNRLSDQEIHHLAGALDGIKAGGEDSPTKRAAGVGIAILIVIGAVAGFYLFYQSNK